MPDAPDKSRSGPDLGCVVAAAVLLAIPLLIWLLVRGMGDGEIGEPAPDREPRAVSPTRRGDAAAIEARLEQSKRELMRARIEQSQSPPGVWDEAIAEKKLEIEALEKQLQALRGK